MRRPAWMTFMMCAGLVACSSSTNDLSTTVSIEPDLAGSPTLFLEQRGAYLDAQSDTTLLITADGCVYLGARPQEARVGVWPAGTTVDVPLRQLVLADGTRIDSGADVLVGGGYTEIYDDLITPASDTPEARACFESTDGRGVYWVGDIRVGNLPD